MGLLFYWMVRRNKMRIQPIRIVECDKCGKEFNIKVKVKKLGKGIEQSYFKWPKCKAKYEVTRNNSNTRRLQKELNRLQINYNKKPSEKGYKEIKMKKEELQKEMLKLNERLR